MYMFIPLDKITCSVDFDLFDMYILHEHSHCCELVRLG